MQQVISTGPLDVATVMIFETLEERLQHDLFCPVHGELIDPEEYHLLDGEEEY